METIVGLGRAGSNIAKVFGKYPQYEAITIDTDGDVDFLLPRMSSAEEYDAEDYEFGALFQKTSHNVTFIVCGGGNVSAATLRILEQIRHKNITIIYVQPDISLLMGEKELHQKAMFGVLQEYARSAVIDRLVLVSNTEMEKMAGDLPIIGYYDKINNLIVQTLHVMGVFDRSDSVMSNHTPIRAGSRITTVSLVEYEKNQEKMFFSLDNETERRYYYAINKKKLETEGGLLNKIKEHLKSNNRGGEVKTSFSIHSTSHDKDYAYCLICTSNIQKTE